MTIFIHFQKIKDIITKFETFLGKNNEHYFRLINGEGEVLLSSEGYTQKYNLLSGIESVKKNITTPASFDMKPQQMVNTFLT